MWMNKHAFNSTTMAPTLESVLAATQERVVSKGSGFVTKILAIALVGILLAVAGGFAAKAAADLTGVSGYTKDTKAAGYSQPVDKAHGYVAGAAAAAWVGFAGLVVTIVVLLVTATTFLVPKTIMNATDAFQTDGPAAVETATTCIAAGGEEGTCVGDAVEPIIDSASSTLSGVIKLALLGVAAFSLFVCSLAARSAWIAQTNLRSKFSSGADKIKFDSYFKRLLIAMGATLGGGLIAVYLLLS